MAIKGALPMAGYLNYLVLIKPFSSAQTALDMATLLASETNASITAYSCGHLSDNDIDHYPSRRDAKHVTLQKQREWISSYLTAYATHDIGIKTSWNSDWPIAASHYADQIAANLIIQGGSNSSTDQQRLLRSAPCPVFITRSVITKPRGIVLAAVDIQGNDDRHIALNHEVVTAAINLATALKSTLHLVCALDEKESIANHLGFEYLSDIDAEKITAADRFGVPAEQTHIQLGNPLKVITEVVTALHAGTLVIGTLARKGITGKLLGNTAEKILLKTQCNLLVVN